MKITDYTVVCNGYAEHFYGSDVMKSAQSGVILEGKPRQFASATDDGSSLLFFVVGFHVLFFACKLLVFPRESSINMNPSFCH